MKFLSRAVLGAAIAIASLGAFAGERAFTQQAFDELRAEGKPVAVHVHATWCGVCKKQAEIVTGLLAQPAFKDLTVLRADFDTDKAVQSALHVTQRSTIVVFKGRDEVGRSAGDTDPGHLSDLLRKAL